MLVYFLILVVGLVAGTVSGVIGTGSSIMLLPVLVFSFGPQEAVPIMGIAAVMANIAKVAAWRREIDWRAFAAYSATGIPAAALGARTLLVLPPRIVDIALGMFFIVMLPLRRWLKSKNIRLRLRHLAAIGGVIGFLTGIVVSTGPLSVPAFTFYGLVKGGFLATEAASSLAVFASKVATFRELGALPADAIVKGVITGAALMSGSFAGKVVVLRMSPNFFQLLLDGLLMLSGGSLLVAAI
jgi:uncharacterized membrane protein YfcA